jgi:hypothetical protein
MSGDVENKRRARRQIGEVEELLRSWDPIGVIERVVDPTQTFCPECGAILLSQFCVATSEDLVGAGLTSREYR